MYKYYKDLINFKNQGDPAVMLRCVNPKEAALLDAASGTHVKFRLAGVSKMFSLFSIEFCICYGVIVRVVVLR